MSERQRRSSTQKGPSIVPKPETTDHRASARIFTVPVGQPFLVSLARALIAGDLPRAGGAKPDEVDLSAITLYLPTRRATRALHDAFLGAAPRRAMLLPNARPISETDEELTLLAGLAGIADLGAGIEDTPPAVSPMERQLVLTQLVMKWSEAMRAASSDETGELGLGPYVGAGAQTPAQAAHLAQELARLIDAAETEAIDLSRLEGLVPDEYSEHWQRTVDFLKIVTQYWPIHLAERRFSSPMDRRNKLILAEAARLVSSPPPCPTIVAGVTGSIPATIELMRAVAGLPNGAIVLPGLDLVLDEESWQAIDEHPEHPQFGFRKLLKQLGVERSAIAVLPGAEPEPQMAVRNRLVAETMRPAATTARWQPFMASADRTEMARAIEGLSLIEAPSAQDEAETISLILREAIETPGRTAALVTPDRLLARRVAIRLDAWGIRVDDSAGRPFAKTVPGTFLDLVIGALARDFAPADVVALLKHPLTRLGLEPFPVRRAARALELAAFRTIYLGRGIEGVEAALDKAASETAADRNVHVAVRRLRPNDWSEARELVRLMKAAFAPLSELWRERGDIPLPKLAAAHVAVAEALALVADTASTADGRTANPLWTGEAGEAASQFFASLIDDTLPAPGIRIADYPDFYRTLIAGRNVLPRTPTHPRVFIWGLMEARLQQPDIVVLGSLNDGTWPEPADPGPWLNRPLRKKLGLPSPEEEIGRKAHDFTSLLGGTRVYMTRAEKMDGVPTVPSRWLLRMRALLDGLGLVDALASDRPWLGWARLRDPEGEREAVAPPSPRPPVEMRPRRMSVSSVETWITNPYAIFASQILKLEPMPALGAAPDASLRGAIIHDALARFSAKFPDTLPGDIRGELLAIASGVIGEYTGSPRVAAFWLPRLERFAQWFAETEPQRRHGLVTSTAEVKGSLVFDAPGGPFTLTARADRIDVTDRGLVITDYKTGAPPSDKRVLAGQAPQLPLEAAIAAAQGFERVPLLPVTSLNYIRASGGEPAGEERAIRSGEMSQLAAASLEGLKRLVATYDDPATPYAAVRRARFRYEYDDYAHLSRVAEWLGEEAEEGAGDGNA